MPPPAAHGAPQPAGGGRGPAESLRTVDAAPGTASARVMPAPAPLAVTDAEPAGAGRARLCRASP